MPTTSKMGIVYPSSSDLVKDGATNMGTIATTVDSKTGLIFISGTTFSAVSSVSLPNSTFTSNFRNYRIIASGTASATTTGDMLFRLRASGSDNSTTNYFSWRYVRSNSAAGNYYNGGEAQGIIGVMGNISWNFVLDLLNPQTTDNVMWNCTANDLANSDNVSLWSNGHFNAGTQFDAASFYPNSGTITGRYSVFGYNA